MGNTTGPTSTTPAFPAAGCNLPGEGVLPLEVLVCHTEAVDLLYRNHGDAGRVLARSVGQNERDAEDIFQEAFTQTIKTINAGDGAPRYFAAELNTAIRAAANVHEPGRRGFVPGALSPYPGPERSRGPGPAGVDGPVLDDFPGYIFLQDVLTAMQSLPGSWQEVLWCADVMGEEPGDIAARMGITPDAVDFLIIHAHIGLREAYQELHHTHHDTAQR